jgi:hypothetical protein
VPEFLDMAHRYLLLVLQDKPEAQTQVNRELLGPPRVNRPTVIDERAGFVPPAWWKGDAYASRSGIAAAFTLRR